MVSTGLRDPVAFYEVKKDVYVLAKKSGNYQNNDLYLVQNTDQGFQTEKLGPVFNKKLRPLKALAAYISGKD